MNLKTRYLALAARPPEWLKNLPDDRPMIITHPSAVEDFPLLLETLAARSLMRSAGQRLNKRQKGSARARHPKRRSAFPLISKREALQCSA